MDLLSSKKNWRNIDRNLYTYHTSYHCDPQSFNPAEAICKTHFHGTTDLQRYRILCNYRQKFPSGILSMPTGNYIWPMSAPPKQVNPYSTGTYTCKSIYNYGLKKFLKTRIIGPRNYFRHWAVIRSWLFFMKNWGKN